MDVSRLLLILTILSYLICSCFCNKFDKLYSREFKLTKFICDVVKSAKNEDPSMNSVGIVKAGNKIDPSTLDGIM